MSDNSGFSFTVTASDATHAGFTSALQHAKKFGVEAAHAISAPFHALSHVIGAPFHALSSINNMALINNSRELVHAVAEVVTELSNWTKEGLQAAAVSQAFAHRMGIAEDQVYSFARQLQEATNGAASLETTMRLTLSGLGKGFSTDQIQKFFEFSSIKAKVSGRDMSEIFEGVTRALLTGRVLALNQVGLLKQGLKGVSEDWEKLHAGKKWSDLESAEQKAIILQKTMEDMADSLKKTGLSGNEAAFSFDRMFKALDDVGLRLKEVVATSPGILHMADAARGVAEHARTFINENFEAIREFGTNAFVSIGQSASDAFGIIGDFKADPTLAAFQSIAEGAELLAQAINGIKIAFDTVATGVQSTSSVMSVSLGLISAKIGHDTGNEFAKNFGKGLIRTGAGAMKSAEKFGGALGGDLDNFNKTTARFAELRAQAIALAAAFHKSNPALDLMDAKLSKFFNTSQTGFARAARSLFHGGGGEGASLGEGFGKLTGGLGRIAEPLQAPLAKWIDKSAGGLKVLDNAVAGLLPGWHAFGVIAHEALHSTGEQTNHLVDKIKELSQAGKNWLEGVAFSFKYNWETAGNAFEAANKRMDTAQEKLKKAQDDLKEFKRETEDRHFETKLAQAGNDPKTIAQMQYTRMLELIGQTKNVGVNTEAGQARLKQAMQMSDELQKNKDLAPGHAFNLANAGDRRALGVQNVVLRRVDAAMAAVDKRLQGQFGIKDNDPSKLLPEELARFKKARDEAHQAVLGRFGFQVDPRVQANLANAAAGGKLAENMFEGAKKNAVDIQNKAIRDAANARFEAIADAARPMVRMFKDAADAGDNMAKRFTKLNPGGPKDGNAPGDIAAVAAAAVAKGVLMAIGF